MDSVDLPSLLERSALRGWSARSEAARRWTLLLSLTAYVLLVDGYHPFAEDGGVYVAGIEKLLHPELFPAFTAFATEHLRFSLFAPALAALVHVTHAPLEWVLLLVYCGSILATLAGGYSLAARTTASSFARAGSVVLLAAALTVPVAGTSLLLTDPYLTARSLSTPLTLFALAFALDALHTKSADERRRARAKVVTCLALAAVLHPLMAAYGLAAILTLGCAAITDARRRHRAFAVLLGLAVAVAAVLQLTAPADTSLYTWVAMTRYYWFPFRWQWYEQFGLLGPVFVLILLARQSGSVQQAQLTRAALTLAAISSAVAVLYCRAHLASHLVARLQPLRCFTVVYLLMLLMLGAWLGEHLLRDSVWRWAALLLTAGALLFFVDRQTFPASAHLEWPGQPSPNRWVEAFRWVRDHTLVDAVFALDAHYITTQGEDAQCFRAIAQRSALPDYSKDGGEASITPALTSAWVAGQSAQTGLEQDTDAQRTAAVLRLGATWMVLRATSPTTFPCPYRNAEVKVCRLQ